MRFSDDILAAVGKSLILGIRAGGGEHKIIGVWAVVVERRVFIRSWGLKPGGWFATFLKEPRGLMEINGTILPVRAVRTRSERLKDAVDEAYAAKYHTKASMRWVKDLQRKASRDSTTELVPVE
ncbi:MAG TPA: DUF2255 family protein [Thermoanaerobaculia bacterium]|nr:DUF2255 family protein [Thermoanaerobaculia bacterium]